MVVKNGVTRSEGREHLLCEQFRREYFRDAIKIVLFVSFAQRHISKASVLLTHLIEGNPSKHLHMFKGAAPLYVRKRDHHRRVNYLVNSHPEGCLPIGSANLRM